MVSVKPGLFLVLAAALAAPLPASARPWQGIQPGVTPLADVVQKFGEPTTRTKRGGKTVLAYFGDNALQGAKQAQFHADAAGVIQEITVFITAQLDADTIEGTYGKPPQKTFVEDTFQKVWIYPQAGVTVYFGKEGGVEALTFTAGKAPKARDAADAQPASAPRQDHPADAGAR
ncbi:MAG: hypothetical protein U0229_19535 [Anaeromyxobacter sp.]